MNNKKFYKVTCFGKSFTSESRESKFCLSYEIGKKTVPKIGKIFVFDNYEKAFNFLVLNNFGAFPVAIMEGEADNPKPLNKCVLYSNLFEDFWLDNKWGTESFVSIMFTPEGTFTVDSFTPEKCVYDYETGRLT